MILKDENGEKELTKIEKLKNKEKYKNKKNKFFYKYTTINTRLEELKTCLKNYYKEKIQDKLFFYELLK